MQAEEEELRAQLDARHEQYREQKRVQCLRRKLKANIEKFANETTDPLFEISVTYNYKGGDYFML